MPENTTQPIKEYAAPKPEFDPTPVTVPAPTTTPQPSATNLQAPGTVVPAKQQAAPPAVQAGTPIPNPADQGNTPSTQAKETISTFAQPAPLSDEAQRAAAEGAAKASSASAAAAQKAGEKQAVAQAEAAAKASEGPAKAASAKPEKPAAAKSSLDQTIADLAPLKDAVVRMAKGDDPIAKIQFNQILTGTGPRNQVMLQTLGMRLKQNHLDGQGSGDAMLAMMARDLSMDTSQLLAGVSAESAKRIYDANLHGFDKSIEIQQVRESQKRTDLANFINSGQIAAAKSVWEDVYPGIPFDESAAKSASPQTIAAFKAGMELVDQYVLQGEGDMANAVFSSLVERMPEMFWDPGDPEGAKAATAGIDFSSEAWANKQAFIKKAKQDAVDAALQGDDASLYSSIDEIYVNLPVSAIEAEAVSAIKTRSLEDINKILDAAGMAPVQSLEEAATIDKTKLAKAVRAYDMRKDANKHAVDILLDQFTDAMPTIGTDPATRQAAKQWLNMHTYTIQTDLDGNTSFDASALSDADIPPWDESSAQAYLFYSWPKAIFNEDGTVSEYLLDAIPYGDDHKPGDLTTEPGREDARLDKAYHDYVVTTPKDKRVPMSVWFYATAGGAKPIDATKTPGGFSDSGGGQPPAPPKYDPSDPGSIDKLVMDYNTTRELTDDMKTALKASGLLTKTTIKDLARDGGNPEAATNLANNGKGGLFQLENGEFIEVLPEGGKYAHHTYMAGLSEETRYYSWVKVRYNGKTYKVDKEGNWFPGDAFLRTSTRSGNLPTIPSPIAGG